MPVVENPLPRTLILSPAALSPLVLPTLTRGPLPVTGGVAVVGGGVVVGTVVVGFGAVVVGFGVVVLGVVVLGGVVDGGGVDGGGVEVVGAGVVVGVTAANDTGTLVSCERSLEPWAATV
ncbi:hypothetical protein FNU77_05435 [Prescottella equi]|nr:hypothetical protein FNU77_05435 [Prescottella equi]